MLHAGQPGFAYAPVSKCVIVACTVMTLLTSMLGPRGRMQMSYSALVERMGWHRVVLQNFAFSTPGELLFGMILLYYFRQFERQWGAARFAAFLLMTTILYNVFQVAFILVALADRVDRAQVTFATGPYAPLFASLLMFFLDTPPTYYFSLLGLLNASDKFFVYLTALQLVISNAPGSLHSGICALIAAAIYRSRHLGLSAIEIPPRVTSFCGTFLSPLIVSSGEVPLASGQSQNADGLEQVGGSATVVTAPPGSTTGAADFLPSNSPTEENVEFLVHMGFSRERAIEALQRSGNDVHEAAGLLVE